MGIRAIKLGVLLTGFMLFAGQSQAFKIEDVNFDTTFGVQNRNYENKPVSPIQRRHEFLSAYFQQEISYTWNGGKDSWVFTPYLATTRYEDPWSIEHEGYVPFLIPIPIFDFGETRTAHRSYGDIRELLWTHVADSSSWEVRTGIGKVFWGVTESQHLVDVINQDDARADIDGEDKLGQPMINLTLVRNFGNLDFFVLPGFREAIYQDQAGRLNPVIRTNPYAPVSQSNKAVMLNQNDSLFESGAEELHTDFAFRWSHSVGINDIGLSYFNGTNRDPVLLTPINEDSFLLQGLPNLNNPRDNWGGRLTNSRPYPSVRYITPYYEQMEQYGLDYQATLEGWLLKFEGIYRDSDSLKTLQDDLASGKTDNFTTDYSAVTAGFEYTFNNIFDSPSDLGVLIEYLWDSREFEASTLNQDDVFFALRYARNDVSDQSLLFGIIQDTQIDSYMIILEASKRVGDDSRIVAEAMHAYADRSGAREEIDVGFDATTGFSEEDHVRLAWETYF